VLYTQQREKQTNAMRMAGEWVGIGLHGNHL
jgi:hypothetical protein